MKTLLILTICRTSSRVKINLNRLITFVTLSAVSASAYLCHFSLERMLKYLIDWWMCLFVCLFVCLVVFPQEHCIMPEYRISRVVDLQRNFFLLLLNNSARRAAHSCASPHYMRRPKVDTSAGFLHHILSGETSLCFTKGRGFASCVRLSPRSFRHVVYSGARTAGLWGFTTHNSKWRLLAGPWNLGRKCSPSCKGIRLEQII